MNLLGFLGQKLKEIRQCNLLWGWFLTACLIVVSAFIYIVLVIPLILAFANIMFLVFLFVLLGFGIALIVGII